MIDDKMKNDKKITQKAAEKYFQKQMNPEISEAFFHYTDEKIYKTGFKDGVNFLTSKMYSEEEVKKLSSNAYNKGYENNTANRENDEYLTSNFNKWFEQNKK